MAIYRYHDPNPRFVDGGVVSNLPPKFVLAEEKGPITKIEKKHQGSWGKLVGTNMGLGIPTVLSGYGWSRGKGTRTT